MDGRSIFLLAMVLLLLLFLSARYYYLQVIDSHNYVTLSDSNRVHVRSIAPVRGLITDRNGVLLAKNVPSYVLQIIPERSADVQKLIGEISEIVDIDDQQRQEFERRHKQSYHRPYQSVPLKFRLNESEVAALAVNEYRLPGMEIKASLARDYPMKDMLAHAVGYVGRINTREQEKIDNSRYEGTHLIGKIGVEKQYEQSLLGTVGYEHVETNVSGKIQRVLSRENATVGSEVSLYLDAKLQAMIYEQYINGDKKSKEPLQGAAVAIEIETGGVLAMVSVPAYDPNPLATGISSKNYNAILSHPGKPLLNRTVLGQYPPGSIVKPTFAIAALDTGAIKFDTKYDDKGYFQLENSERKYRDWKRKGHGMVNLKSAIAQSCDVFFYQLGLATGIDTLRDYGQKFSFGLKTGIDFPIEKKGTMPSPLDKKWSDGDTVNVSIGQGDMLVTPLQMAHNTAIIARKGKVIVPKMVKSINHQETLSPVIEQIELSDKIWEYVHQGMVDVVHSYQGTARALKVKQSYKIAGKSGTAQIVSIAQEEEYDSSILKKEQRDHAWFVAFAPAEKPLIAIAVLVENGEAGSSAAAPIAKKAIEFWLSSQPLPEQNLSMQNIEGAVASYE